MRATCRAATASELSLSFQYLAPVRGSGDRASIGRGILGIEWEAVLLYPAGPSVDAVRVVPRLKLPPRWQQASALRGPAGEAVQPGADGWITFGEVSVETLVDSPLFAGRHLKQIPLEQKIIFGPDKHLGGYLARKTGRDMLLWPGVCIVHEAFSETELLKLKAQHPEAPVLAHPECPPHILDHATHVGSTSSILAHALASPSQTLIVATEPHIIHQMEKAAPHKTFIGAPGADGNCNCNMCPYMALNTMEKLYLSLRDLEPRIEIEEGLRVRAKRSLDRMLEMAANTVGKGDVGRPIISGD